ncbi:MAG: hypothetical protein ACRBCT_09770 [Alphaproteobacteria bacterium]
MANKTQTGLTQEAKRTFAPKTSLHPVARPTSITSSQIKDAWNISAYAGLDQTQIHDGDFKFDAASLAGLISPLDLPLYQDAPPKADANPQTHKPTITPPDDLGLATQITEALTGYNAVFLAQKAFVESTHGKNMGKPSGFVYGYYQFSQVATHEGIEQLMKLPAADIIAHLVPDIKKLHDGNLDSATEKALLDKVRTDPLAASLINAGYNIRYTKQYAAELTGPVSYLIHFGGPGNGKRLIEGYKDNPETLGVALLRSGENSNILSKAANRNIFYHDGDTNSPRTIGEIVSFLEHEKGFGNHIIYEPVTTQDLEDFDITQWSGTQYSAITPPPALDLANPQG